MDSWSNGAPILLVLILMVSFSILNRIKALAHRIEQLEAERHYFTTEAQEQKENLVSEVSELRCLLKDLADFQKGDGRYRNYPDDPRLPAHIRDRENRDD
uniref:hypothetical protein n=1 Tax=Pseudomonas fulva TaxID=47880 RepID=UPI001F356BC7|nr:hypothetical protein [Pseudomonas fulva]